MSFFFDDLPTALAVRASTLREDALTRRESLELVRNYHHISDDLRKRVYDLVKAMARADGDDEKSR